jgi:hypothetical protein
MQVSRRGAKFGRLRAKAGTAVPTLQCYAVTENFEDGPKKRPHIPSMSASLNRSFGIKRFQTVHHCSVDVAYLRQHFGGDGYAKSPSGLKVLITSSSKRHVSNSASVAPAASVGGAVVSA